MIYFDFIVLDLLHNPPKFEESLSLPTELLELVWNMGIFYMLHTLHFTRLSDTKDTKIRLSPEVWTELLLAYERFSFFPEYTSQAMRIFRLLVSNDVFQFGLYTGVPSLYRVMAVIQEHSLSPHLVSTSLTAYSETNRKIQSQLVHYSEIMDGEILPIPVQMSYHQQQSTSSSSLIEINDTARKANELGLVDDSTLSEFFATNHRSISPVVADSHRKESEETSPANVLTALQELESVSKQIMDNTSILVGESAVESQLIEERSGGMKKTKTTVKRPSKSIGAPKPFNSSSHKENPSENLVKKKKKAKQPLKTAGKSNKLSADSVKSSSAVVDALSKLEDDTSTVLRRRDNVAVSSSVIDVLSKLESESSMILDDKRKVHKAGPESKVAKKKPK